MLIPRPETELIVEAALQLFPSPAEALAIADVGTGSGCLAVALACERSAARVVATDISESRARRRAAQRRTTRRGRPDRVRRGDLLDRFADPVDLIVSNPPYVATRDRTGLQPEVRDYEPDDRALRRQRGLEIIRRLVDRAPTRLRVGGYLIFEFGFGQDEAIESLIGNTAGLRLLELRRDLQGIPRTAIAERVVVRRRSWLSQG